ncbi:MAG: AAA family ATPase, partial [Solirubrobacterales bacterium]
LWPEMQATIPPGLAEFGELKVSISPEDFVPWLAESVTLRLVTGPHDADSVAPVEVGSGLQSLLELATQQAAATTTGGNRILAVEEPEAYLHPSAQRTLARLIAEELPGKRIVSTHSPLLVEEATYGDVVLVRDHQFYESAPLSMADPNRASINTALLTGFGAEMAFARTVLLVEGEGDRLFFEWLRRRLARNSGDGRIDEMYVLPTGSKTSFCPWLRLLLSYGRDGDRPVSWLAAPDSDGATDIRRAWKGAGLTLPTAVSRELMAPSNVPKQNRTDVLAATRAVNAAAAKAGVGIELLPPDVEGVMLADCAPSTIARLCEEVDAPRCSKATFETWLGNNKAPWMRAIIARETPWGEVSQDAKSVLKRWLSGVMAPAEAGHLLERMN